MVITIGKHISEWEKVNLSDPNTIKGLLKFRYRFDALLDYRNCSYDVLASTTDLSDVDDNLICLYADLDNLINKASFNTYQTNILKLYMEGNNEDDIAEILNVGKQSINSVIDNMSNILCELNYQNWKLNYVFWDIKKVNTNYKKCSKCGEFLPATEEYFSPNPSSKDGFYSICRECKQNIDKLRKSE